MFYFLNAFNGRRTNLADILVILRISHETNFRGAFLKNPKDLQEIFFKRFREVT